MAIFKNSPPIITSGLVFNIDAANTKSYPNKTGLIWYDLSGNNYTGSLVNGPIYSSNGGGSIFFDATNDYANFGVISNTLFSTNQFSVTSWVNIFGAARGDIWGVKNFNVNQDDLGVYIDTTNFIIFYYKVLGVITSFQSTLRVNRNVMNHICVQKTLDSKVEIYINGVFDRAFAGATPNSANAVPTELWIGANRFNATTPQTTLNGNIASLQFYNRILSVDEVYRNYNAQKSRYNLK